MATKVKGLFRGLRYISQIFDEKEEDEIQIGFPTDVKHVAHIGMDGPSANTPTWMNDFKTASEVSQQAPAPVNTDKTQRDSKASKDSKHKAKHIPKSRHGSLEKNSTDSPSGGSSGGSKHVRRHRSSDATSECSSRDSSSSSGSRHSRKAKSSKPGSDSPTASKQGRRRKTKTKSIDETEGVERSSGRSSKGDSMSDISFPDLAIGSENGHRRKNSDD
ncbi:hypothetical protein K1719_030589 [Acacia pycnantha]|nr:hypothetical protein K1719_030589 [Acacia pycnantha]